MRICAVCKRCFRQYYNVPLRWMKRKQWQELKVHLQWILSYVKWKHQLSDRCIFMCFLGSSIWRESQVLLSLWKKESSALHLFINFTARLRYVWHRGTCNNSITIFFYWCHQSVSDDVGEIEKKKKLKKKKLKKPLAVLLRCLEDALLCAKGDECLFLRYVDEGLWRTR